MLLTTSLALIGISPQYVIQVVEKLWSFVTVTIEIDEVYTSQGHRGYVYGYVHIIIYAECSLQKH